MRVGIVTQPLTNNYGGYLQAWALQEALRRMGHKPVTMDLKRPVARQWRPESPRWWASVAKRSAQIYLMGKRSELVHVSPGRAVNHWNTPRPAMQAFQRSHLELCDVGAGAIATEPEGFDAWIVGSDQVWRPRFNQYPENCFLDFVAGDKPRVAYAASLGSDRWEFDPATTSRLRPLAQRLTAVSMREESAIGVVREALGIEATHVLDPTLLLEAADYRRLYGSSTAPQRQYMAVYVLDDSPAYRALVSEASRLTGLPARRCGEPDGSIESWLRCIDEADCVLTDSFHGSVFSVIFGKAFATIGNAARGNARFHSLLTALGLTDRLATAATAAGVAPLLTRPLPAAVAPDPAPSLAWLKHALT